MNDNRFDGSDEIDWDADSDSGSAVFRFIIGAAVVVLAIVAVLAFFVLTKG